MGTFLLTHGGWHGAWCWTRVTSILAQAGHTVSTPTLTGLGERRALLDANVGLDTHIQDVVDVIEREDLYDVVLVGHSYASLVITGVADRVPSRISHLIYLDTFVPRDGESQADIVPLVVGYLRRQARLRGDGWRVDPLRMPFGIGGLYGVTDEADVDWIRTMETPQSLKTFEQPLRLSNPNWLATLPRTHIWCTGGGPLFRLLRRVLMPRTLPPKEPGWYLRKLPTGHDAMITMPTQLAAMLLDVSGCARVDAGSTESAGYSASFAGEPGGQTVTVRWQGQSSADHQ